MAARANKASVEAAVNGPDYEGALAIINGRVASAKEAQSKASGNASQAWGDVEKLGVNKRGAQMFARIQGIEEEDERQDQLRTFFKLCQLEGIGISVDLVDQAQGRTDHPVPQAPKPEANVGAPPADDSDLIAAADAPAEGDKLAEKPKRTGKAATGNVVGLDEARKHLNGKPKGDVPDATD